MARQLAGMNVIAASATRIGRAAWPKKQFWLLGKPAAYLGKAPSQ
jgi:hypothetical protein